MAHEAEPWNVTIYMNYVECMNPWEFEKLCAEALLLNGFEQSGVTPGSGDYGVDIIAIKDGLRWAIQCKRYTPPRRVGEDVVHTLVRGANIWKCQRAAILTTTTFTPQARYIAPQVGVELWPRIQLYYMLNRALKGRQFL